MNSNELLRITKSTVIAQIRLTMGRVCWSYCTFQPQFVYYCVFNNGVVLFREVKGQTANLKQTHPVYNDLANYRDSDIAFTLCRLEVKGSKSFDVAHTNSRFLPNLCDNWIKLGFNCCLLQLLIKNLWKYCKCLFLGSVGRFVNFHLF